MIALDDCSGACHTLFDVRFCARPVTLDCNKRNNGLTRMAEAASAVYGLFAERV